jgi:ribonuclease H2 subunit A
MVYGMAFWNENDHSKETQELRAAFGDSKQLTEEKREMLFQKILSSSFSNDGNTGSSIGFGVKILHASEISRHMLRRSSVYNLNQMSHDAAMALIRSLQQQLLLLSKNHHAASISTCYIDTVGNPQTYQRQLERAFPGIRFVVESKADDTYPPCSAASIGTFPKVSL